MKICASCKAEFVGGEVFCPNDGARLITASQYDGSKIASSGDDPLVGTILADRYQILRQIGEGGMGLVYEAEHIAIEKRVALKVLRDDFSSRPEVVARFRQEAKSASRIGNEHIVDISDFGTTPSGASYFVMELLTGDDLANVLAAEGHLPLERAADIILQCCKALGAAHSKGIVHRDMKPENIFLTDKEGHPDFVKLVDFGIAKMSDIETDGAPGRKLTKTGMIFGTPEYMSPEQAAGKPLDHRVDVYALAVILFEMLSGRVPFIGDTFMGILTQHMFEDPPELHTVNPHVVVPDAVLAFIAKGLAKEPDERFQSCQEMAEALREALEGKAVSTPTRVGHAEPAPLSPAPEGAGALPTPAPSEVGMPVASQPSRLAVVGLVGAIIAAAAVGAGVVWYVGQGEAVEADPVVSPVGSAADAVQGDGGAERASAVGGDGAGGDAGGAMVAEADSDAGAVADPAGLNGEPAEPALVTVSVSTTPVGAHVYVEGRGEVCDASPCSFETEASEAITVRARRGRNQAQTTLTPEENTTVQLELRRVRPAGRRSGRGGRGRRSDGQPGSGSSSAGMGDLKVPDIFRRN